MEVKKIHASEAYRNRAKLSYVHPLWFIKNLWQIHLRVSHMKFRGKNKVSNIMWAKLCGLIGWKHQNSFQYKLMQKISLSVSSKQASKHLVSSFPFSFMNDIHKPSHKKKNYLKYFADCTSSLKRSLWVCQGQKNLKRNSTSEVPVCCILKYIFYLHQEMLLFFSKHLTCSWFLRGYKVHHIRLSPLPKNFEYLPLRLLFRLAVFPKLIW